MRKLSFREIKERYRTPRDISGRYPMGSRLIFSNLAIPIIWLLLKTRVTGNQVTLFWILLGILSCLLFCFGSYWLSLAGCFLFFFHVVLDYVDGAIARARGEVSREGMYLDRMGHDVIYPSSFFCLAVGATRIYSAKFILIIGFLASLGYLMYHWSRRAKVLTAVLTPYSGDPSTPNTHSTQKRSLFHKLYRRIHPVWCPQNYRLLMLVAAILGKLHWLILFYGFTYPILATASFIHQARCGYDWVFEDLAQVQSKDPLLREVNVIDHEG